MRSDSRNQVQRLKPSSNGEILVGVDGCPSSDAAVVWAAGDAASRGLGLAFVHALDVNSIGLALTTPVGGSDATTAGTVSRIIVGMGEGPAQDAALQFAFDEAQRRCLPLEALHVLRRAGSPSSELVDDPHPEHRDAEEQQAKLLDEWAATYPGVAVTSIVRGGHLGEVFADTCRVTDLLVLGHHRHAPYSPYHLGPAATAALHHTSCSVAVVHVPAQGAPVDQDCDWEREGE